jgi:hypothetical protein
MAIRPAQKPRITQRIEVPMKRPDQPHENT